MCKCWQQQQQQRGHQPARPHLLLKSFSIYLLCFFFFHISYMYIGRVLKLNDCFGRLCVWIECANVCVCVCLASARCAYRHYNIEKPHRTLCDRELVLFLSALNHLVFFLFAQYIYIYICGWRKRNTMSDVSNVLMRLQKNNSHCTRIWNWINWLDAPLRLCIAWHDNA